MKRSNNRRNHDSTTASDRDWRSIRANKSVAISGIPSHPPHTLPHLAWSGAGGSSYGGRSILPPAASEVIGSLQAPTLLLSHTSVIY